MKREKIRICIMRVGGTNCDEETRTALEHLGVRAEVVHTKRIIDKQNLLDSVSYTHLTLPTKRIV